MVSNLDSFISALRSGWSGDVGGPYNNYSTAEDERNSVNKRLRSQGLKNRKMESSDNMIDCLAAKRMLEMIILSLDSYLPPALHDRFVQVAAAFEKQDQSYWIEKAETKRGVIANAFQKLGEWSDMEDAELLMRAWDDDVFFFYVLRTQFVFSRLAAKPDDMIPGTLDGFWKWGMTPKDNEVWMLYPVLTAQNYSVAPIKPPIWKIPYPRDYPQSSRL